MAGTVVVLPKLAPFFTAKHTEIITQLTTDESTSYNIYHEVKTTTATLACHRLIYRFREPKLLRVFLQPAEVFFKQRKPYRVHEL
jgi:hypothetical protein